MADSKLKVWIYGDADSLEEALKSAEGNVQKLGDSVQNAGKKMTLFVTGPLAAGAVGLVALASDLEESESKFNTVFGNINDEADRWARDQAALIGRGVKDTKDQLADYAVVLQGMDYSTEDALKYSQTLTAMTADLGSFHNKAEEYVSLALKGALTGEFESLKSMGIVLRAADVDMRALANTGKETSTALTEAERVQARMELTMERAGVAIGDAERTADSFANQMKALKGEAHDAAADLGTFLIPVAKDVVEVARSAIAWFAGLSDEWKKTILITGAVVAAIGPLLFGIGTAIKLLPILVTGWGAASKAALWFAGAAKAAWLALTGPVGLVVLIVTGALATMGAAIYFFGDTIGEVLGKAVGLVTDLFVGYVNLWIGAINTFSEGINSLVGTDIPKLDDIPPIGDRVGTAIKNMGKDAQEGLQNIVDGAVSAVAGMTDLGSQTDDLDVDVNADVTVNPKKVTMGGTGEGGGLGSIRILDPITVTATRVLMTLEEGALVPPADLSEWTLPPPTIDPAAWEDLGIPDITAEWYKAGFHSEEAYNNWKDFSGIDESMQEVKWSEFGTAGMQAFSDIGIALTALGEILPGKLGELAGEIGGWIGERVAEITTYVNAINSIANAWTSVTNLVTKALNLIDRATGGGGGGGIGSAVGAAAGAAGAGGIPIPSPLPVGSLAGPAAVGGTGAGGVGAGGAAAGVGAGTLAAGTAAFLGGALGAIELLQPGAVGTLFGGAGKGTSTSGQAPGGHAPAQDMSAAIRRTWDQWIAMGAVPEKMAAYGYGPDSDPYIWAAASGFLGKVDRKTLFMAGDAGPEMVFMKPASQHPSHMGMGTTVINNFFGPVGTDDIGQSHVDDIRRAGIGGI